MPGGFGLDARTGFFISPSEAGAQGGGGVPVPEVFKGGVDVALRDLAWWWDLVYGWERGCERRQDT